MPNITITLLTNKRSRQSIDGLDTIVAAQAGGYSVIENENNATTFEVRYPAAYRGQAGTVYMKNAKGEYSTLAINSIGDTYTFTLPATMTVAGNTLLVFQAQSGDVKTIWAPVVVPITATSVDYRQVAMASPDILAEAIAVAAAAAAGDFNGDSCFIRYASDANGANFSQTWSAGLKYVGFYIGKTAPTDPTQYRWSLFVGQSVAAEDNSSQAIEYELEDNVDKTFKADGISSLRFIIPATVKHGFYCGVNVKTGATVASVLAATNNSPYPIKYMERGYETTHFTQLPTNSVVLFAFFCDGLYLYCYITEAEIN